MKLKNPRQIRIVDSVADRLKTGAKDIVDVPQNERA
eukprot:CAMPEP_0196665810 /NCGR_PEP_ID=MMETSP1086-20130531/62650_1 /TAXON_ID=77921 /ORGANISM="Cyanoptyche  gloeocystis , Strain SAG4.97" /LENGTH=35 /DNA_ID= /DNA_START= /DNA_END= /DNA_ORIENTATION=